MGLERVSSYCIGAATMTNDIDYIQLGKRIKRYRQKSHLTQDMLADKIDVATFTIAHAENVTSKPSLSLLLKVANALNVTLDQLVYDSLPNVEAHLKKDIADLLADCTLTEEKIIHDIIMATKETFHKRR